jgi:murein DD-endopeptidase MepM/ murein hydrolase activator NlpD
MRSSTHTSVPSVGRHRRTGRPGRHRAAPPAPRHATAVATASLGGAAALASVLGAVDSGNPASAVDRSATTALITAVPAETTPPAMRPQPLQTAFGGVPAADGVQQRVRPRPVAPWVDPMPAGTVTSCFGPRWGRLHAGVDRAAATGTPIVAAAAGTVASAGSVYGGYGISVLIQHDGGISTHYAHLSATPVRPGERVAAGQPIGAEGSTGRSTGPHLHFEVRDGGWDDTVDPAVWMRERGVDLGCAAL